MGKGIFIQAGIFEILEISQIGHFSQVWRKRHFQPYYTHSNFLWFQCFWTVMVHTCLRIELQKLFIFMKHIEKHYFIDSFC